MTIVYVQYEEHSTGGEKLNPKDDWSCHADLITNFTVKGISLVEPPGHYYEAFDVNLADDIKELYVIHVRYTTGGSFGRELGRGKIIDICSTQAGAETQLNAIEKGTHPMSYCWTGYFDKLESCQADLFALSGGVKSLRRTFT